MARLVAIDYGKRRIGIAVTDPLQKMAFPHVMLETAKTLPETAKKLLIELSKLGEIEKIIVGLPLEMTGKEGPMAQEVRVFAAALLQALPIPQVFWDERLTSSQADTVFREVNMTRRERSKKSDTTAAYIILQSYLDNQLLR